MSKDKATEPTEPTTPAVEPAAAPDLSKTLSDVTNKIVALEGTLTTLSDNYKSIEKKLGKAQDFIKEKAGKGDPDAAKQVEDQERQRLEEVATNATREAESLKAQLHKHTVVNEVKRVIGGKFSSSAFAQEALEARISRHATRDEKTGKLIFKDENGNILFKPNSAEHMGAEDFGNYLAAQMKEIALSDAVSGVRPAGQSTSGTGTTGAAEPPPGLNYQQQVDWYTKNLKTARPPSLTGN